MAGPWQAFASRPHGAYALVRGQKINLRASHIVGRSGLDSACQRGRPWYGWGYRGSRCNMPLSWCAGRLPWSGGVKFPWICPKLWDARAGRHAPRCTPASAPGLACPGHGYRSAPGARERGLQRAGRGAVRSLHGAHACVCARNSTLPARSQGDVAQLIVTLRTGTVTRARGALAVSILRALACVSAAQHG